jgi:DNA-binding NarL/FixJ family response regulator
MTTKRKAMPGKGASSGVSLMLVDDHPLWREMLRQILEHKRVGTVIAEASDGEEALKLAADRPPDVVIMDVDLPGMDGVEATRRLTADHPDVRVLFLSGFEEKDAVVEAVQAGASGYLPKTASANEVADAIVRVRAGELVLPPSLSMIVVDELRRLADRDMHPARADSVGSPQRHRRPSREARAPEMANAFLLEGEFWTLVFAGEVVRMRDSKGLRYIAQLITAGGQEVHVSELVLGGERTAAAELMTAKGLAESGLERSGPGEAGPLLDAQAKAEYRQRLGDLESELDEAEAWADPERATRAREEMDFLTRELAAAVGLGGRDRPAASPVERFRVNVSRAVRSALSRIAERHAALGMHLERSIRTGTFCSYKPSEATEWVL